MTIQVITENTTVQNATADEQFSGVEDTWLDQANASTNNNTSAVLLVNKAVTSQYKNSLIQFDLSNIPANKSIISATIYLKVETAPASTKSTQFRYLLRNWGLTTATWTNYDTGSPWGTAGGLSNGVDRTTSAEAAIAAENTDDETWLSASLLTSVTAMYQGSIVNNGWHMESGGFTFPDSLTIQFHSSNATDGNRPELVIEYTNLQYDAGPTIEKSTDTIALISATASYI